MRKRYNRNRIATIEDELLARKHQQTTASVLGTGGGGGGLTVPAGADGAVQYNDGGAFGGEAALIYDDEFDRLGLFGWGALNTWPQASLHLERNTTGADQTFVWCKNRSPYGVTQVAAELDWAGAYAALASWGSQFAGIAGLAGKAGLYGSSATLGTAILADAGMIEFWLRGEGYPAGTYTQIAVVATLTGNYPGILPATDSARVLGVENDGAGNPLRWADGSFDQLHVNSYLLSMSGALTVEAASAINQDLTTDSTTAQFGQVGIGAANPLGFPSLRIYSNQSGETFERLRLEVGAGYTNTVGMTFYRGNVEMGRIDCDYWDGLRFYARGTDEGGSAVAIFLAGDATVADAPKIGFLGATPVVRQAYTTVSNPPTQAEVTAIRDALVNLGLMAAA